MWWRQGVLRSINIGERRNAMPNSQQRTPTAISDEVVPAGSPWARVIKQGHSLRIIDVHGHQGVDFLCYNADDPEERYHAPNTLKAARTLRLTKGHVLYSDVARPLFSITEDTCRNHDTIGGCCSAQSNEMLYGVMNCPGCRENFLTALAEFGLGRKDIVANINFFCNVPVGDQGRLADAVFVESRSAPGSYVELRAEMDALAIISNCPQVNNPCNAGEPTAIRVMVLAGESSSMPAPGEADSSGAPA
jgi:urea carboxylase-associated protein 1